MSDNYYGDSQRLNVPNPEKSPDKKWDTQDKKDFEKGATGSPWLEKASELYKSLIGGKK